MECPRGSETTDTTHEVKTLSKAKEWFAGALEEHLPLCINQQIATGGRRRISVFSASGELLHRRG